MHSAGPSKDEDKANTYWRNTILSRIFEEDIDFEKEAEFKHW